MLAFLPFSSTAFNIKKDFVDLNFDEGYQRIFRNPRTAVGVINGKKYQKNDREEEYT